MDCILVVEDVHKACDSKLLDSMGQTVKFGDLMNDKGKTIVIFIRHFFCGACQAYLSKLAEVEVEALEKAQIKIVVIGCGDYQPIKSYQQKTGYHGPIYADSTRELFNHFGLIESLKVTPKGQVLKSYLAGSSRLTQVLNSIWTGPLKQPQYIGKQGNISQLGGEFIFEPNNTCIYAHRMQHTQDHTEIAELLEHAGVQAKTLLMSRSVLSSNIE